MDELFEALTLVQTRKVNQFPVVLMGTAYWCRAARLAARARMLGRATSARRPRPAPVTDDVDEAIAHIDGAGASAPRPPVATGPASDAGRPSA